MDSLAPDVIEGIEVMRAASAEFSTQAVAGTINIVLKKAIKNAQRELKAGIASGNGFIGPNANLQMSDRAGKLSYSLSTNVFHQRFERNNSAREQGVDLAGAPNLQRNSAFAEEGRFTAINLSPRLNWACR
jgi:outer membrane receptor for ferrienterochelin and colicins